MMATQTANWAQMMRRAGAAMAVAAFGTFAPLASAASEDPGLADYEPLLPVYVDPVDGSDETGDGKTWETAVKTIASAVAKTKLPAYYNERRCQVVLKKGVYVLDTSVSLPARAQLVGDPACDRSEIVLTAPADATPSSLISISADPIDGFVNLVANLTISNVTLKGGAAIYGWLSAHDRWSRVVSNVVVTLCRQTNGGSLCAAGVYADGRTFVTDCVFSCLTNTGGYGVASCAKGGWFRNCRIESCSTQGSGQIQAYVDGGLTPYFGVEGCTFTNNYAQSNGGGVSNIPIVRDCTFVNNTCGGSGSAGFWGGNAYYTNDLPSVVNCTFIGNNAPTADSAGGVLSFQRGGTISNCTFVGNVSAGYCAAVAKPLAVFDSTFTSNSCTRSWTGTGAIDVSSGNAAYSWQTPRIEGCTFVGNSTGTGADGGAILARWPVAISGCTFRENTADCGGAIYATSAGNANFLSSVRNCRFIGNKAQFTGNSNGGGGALYDVAMVSDSTFEGNVAARNGGGLAWSSSITNGVIRNCVFSGNSAARNGGGALLSETYGANNLVDAMITDCVFTNNAAGGSGNYLGGAGLYAWIGGVEATVGLRVRNCFFVGNTLTNETAAGCGSAAVLMAGWNGGKGQLFVESCTMVSNRSSVGSAAALYAWPGTGDVGTHVTNTLIACNFNADGSYASVLGSVYGLGSNMDATIAKMGYSYLHPQSSYIAQKLTEEQHVVCTNDVPKFRSGTWIPSDSRLRDVGVTQDWMADAHDLQRNDKGRATVARIYGAAVDIGAFEWAPSAQGLILIVR